MGLTDSGLAGNLYKHLTGAATELKCSLVGPNFMSIRIDSTDCPSGVYFSNIFKSDAHFCDKYRQAPPDQKKCLSSAVVDFKIKIKGVFSFGEIVGKCCNFRYAKSKSNEISSNDVLDDEIPIKRISSLI